MCGRYALNTTPQELAETFKLDRSLAFSARFNIAPASLVPVIRQSPQGELVADLLRWGLIPHWARDPAIGAKLNNARGESLTEKPSFRDAFRRRRCLIPATGYYEWKTEGKNKQPYFIHAKSGELLAMGGLWESWRSPDGEILRTFCVITTGPSTVIEPIHDRMPLLLRQKDHKQWLDPAISGSKILELVVPFASEGLDAWPVSKAVSRAENEGPTLIERMDVP